MNFLEWIDRVEDQVQRRIGMDLADCDLRRIVRLGDLTFFWMNGVTVEAAVNILMKRTIRRGLACA